MVEDLYRPYRPKRKTRASVAKEKGLEPLAEFILAQETDKPVIEKAAEFISEEKEVKTAEEALQGAKDIIAESISMKRIIVFISEILRLRKAKLSVQQKTKRQRASMKCTIIMKNRLAKWQVTEHLH